MDLRPTRVVHIFVLHTFSLWTTWYKLCWSSYISLRATCGLMPIWGAECESPTLALYWHIPCQVGSPVSRSLSHWSHVHCLLGTSTPCARARTCARGHTPGLLCPVHVLSFSSVSQLLPLCVPFLLPFLWYLSTPSGSAPNTIFWHFFRKNTIVSDFPGFFGKNVFWGQFRRVERRRRNGPETWLSRVNAPKTAEKRNGHSFLGRNSELRVAHSWLRGWSPSACRALIASVSLTHIPYYFACLYESVSCAYALFSTCLSTWISRGACFVFYSIFITIFFNFKIYIYIPIAEHIT